MGKKITSSSPLNTIAFDSIPTVSPYTRELKVHKVTGTGSTSSTSVTPSFYTSTNKNSDMISENSEESGCPIGKHMEKGICVKNKKEGRKDRLTRKIDEDISMGKTASAARKRKRLAGYELGQEKRTKQIEEGGKTFAGRFFSNVKDIFDTGAHKGTFDTEGKPEKYDKSRHDLKLERAKDIKTKGDTRRQDAANKAKCTAKGQGWKWENGGCVKKQSTNFNPVSTSSTTNYSQATNEGDCISANGRWSGGECWSK